MGVLDIDITTIIDSPVYTCPLLDWWQRLSDLWNACWVEIMSSWMSCALMPLNFTSDFIWSCWYFGPLSLHHSCSIVFYLHHLCIIHQCVFTCPLKNWLMENDFQSDTNCHVRLWRFLKMTSVFPKQEKPSPHDP